jgi:hypothetical protein
MFLEYVNKLTSVSTGKLDSNKKYWYKTEPNPRLNFQTVAALFGTQPRIMDANKNDNRKKTWKSSPLQTIRSLL